MARYSSPPAPLSSAINSASKQYDVPPDILTGIWRVESNSTYPNPYRNSLGYGGLFGTKDWSGSTISQADLSASILQTQLIDKNGNISSALMAYSGGGYSQVPGETTFGTWMPKKGGGSSILHDITSAIPIPGLGGLPIPIPNPSNIFKDPLGSIASLFYQFAFILVGAGLILVGLFLIARALMSVGAPNTIRTIERVTALRQGQIRTEQAGRRVAATEASGERTQQRIAIQERRQQLAEQKEARLQSMT